MTNVFQACLNGTPFVPVSIFFHSNGLGGIKSCFQAGEVFAIPSDGGQLVPEINNSLNLLTDH
ncbi:hypothetical protein BpHYR1_030868 [Brachionus plicatilis]|uniref:Uncharacterized protein n=1 Tax=Brachionus plicatilis TaxID=10195 RepID=A0A3M7PYH1_BRAPC|nr:hypothetical protein BpHYR1_030868 [Brachionus plicatilis]